MDRASRCARVQRSIFGQDSCVRMAAARVVSGTVTGIEPRQHNSHGRAHLPGHCRVLADYQSFSHGVAPSFLSHRPECQSCFWRFRHTRVISATSWHHG